MRCCLQGKDERWRHSRSARLLCFERQGTVSSAKMEETQRDAPDADWLRHVLRKVLRLATRETLILIHRGMGMCHGQSETRIRASECVISGWR